MTEIAIYGAGAFGTALAISLAQDGKKVALIARDPVHAAEMSAKCENSKYLPGFAIPSSVSLGPIPVLSDVCLMAVPAQTLAAYSAKLANHLAGASVIACCKGVDLETGKGPTASITENCDASSAAILSGPSFAVDIAAGLPTALTIATGSDAAGRQLQSLLSTTNLRLYRSTDITGVELGGALKNVIAIAAGVTMGAGLGHSARAAIITRGYAEMKRFAQAAGARPETLSGMSGFGDLVLTCTSEKSRNYAFGFKMGEKGATNTALTVEGIATAKAVMQLAEIRGIDMPITGVVGMLVDGKMNVEQAIGMLLARPLTKE